MAPLPSELPFPEFARMREVVRLLGAESYLLAKAGEYEKAVRNQALGFRVAEHARTDPTTIAYLVTAACHRLTLLAGG